MQEEYILGRGGGCLLIRESGEIMTFAHLSVSGG